MLRLVRFDHTNPSEVRLDAKPVEKGGILLDIYSMKFSEGMKFKLTNAEANILAQALNTWLKEDKK